MTVVQRDYCHEKGRKVVRVWSECHSSIIGHSASTFMDNHGKWHNIRINRSESISYLMETPATTQTHARARHASMVVWEPPHVSVIFLGWKAAGLRPSEGTEGHDHAAIMV